MSLVEARDLYTWFATDRGIIRAVDGVSVRIESGETLGIVGESGSGKSALIRSIMGLHASANLARYDGSVRFDGTDLRTLAPDKLQRIWGRRIGIIFQDPMTALNPVVRVGRQITEVLRHHLGMSGRAATTRAIELLTSLGIPAPAARLRAYPSELSGGMRQRVAIAIALACDPDLVIADEPTTALDVTVQAQILALLRGLQRDRGMALVLVTHDLGVVSGIADRIAVMYTGRVVEEGPTDRVILDPRMPYTQALLASSPRLEHEAGKRLPTIPGRPPMPIGEIRGCPFAPRCPHVQDRCQAERPPLLVEDERRSFACWFPVRDAQPWAGAETAEGGRSDGR